MLNQLTTTVLSRTQVRAAQRRLAAGADGLVPVFDALGDRSRYRIFRLLLDESEVCVTDVANVLGISVPAASQQLRLLDRSGLVEHERMGQMICYVIRRSNPVVRLLVRMIEIRDGDKGTR